MTELEAGILRALRDKGDQTWYTLDHILAKEGLADGQNLAQIARQMADLGLIEILPGQTPSMPVSGTRPKYK